MIAHSHRPTRRGFLKTSAAGAALISLSLRAQAASMQDLPPLSEYQPFWLTSEEWAFVVAACARLIPSEGNGPGAIEARVPVFIDLQLAGDFGKGSDWFMAGPFQPDADPLLGFQSPLSPAGIYRRAIPVFDAWCREKHGDRFAALAPDVQDAALTALQKGEMTLPPELRDFFPFLLQNVKEGFFADPSHGGNYKMQAWVWIGFPGARGAFPEWVGRPNATYPLGPVALDGERA